MYEPSVVVRRAEARDAEALAGLIERFYRFNEEFDPAWAVAAEAGEKALELAKAYITDENSVVLVAEADGRVVGFVRAEVRDRPMLEAGRIGVIVELYVHPQYRRRGVAGRLVDEALRQLAGRGVRVLGAEFPSANVIARRFYEKHGFRPYTSVYIRDVGV